MSKTTATGALRITRRMPVLRFLARAGFAVNGLLHAVIGYLAIRVAAGAYVQADPDGAFGQIRSSLGGLFVLWAVSIGLAALGIWLVLGAFLLHPRDSKTGAMRFAIELGKGVAYLALAAAAFAYAWQGAGPSSAGSPSVSASVMASPGGLFLVALIGVGVLAVGGYFVVKGVRRTFTDDIDVPSGTAGRGVVAMGVWGYVSKGVALAIVGVLFIGAAVTTDTSAATGLDGALKSLLTLPLGPVIVSVVGAGFIAYGVYCLVRAKYARL
ncbi:MAG: DUF1206 domain-containing protein [Pseudolysinimonas sp.]